MSDGPFSFGGSPVASHASQHSRQESLSQCSGVTGGQCSAMMSTICSAVVPGGSDDLQAGHFFIPSLYCWTAWFLLYISQSSPSLSMRADRRARAGEVFPSIIPRAASSSLAMLKMLR